MFPQLTAEQQVTVANEILAFTSKISYKPADREHVSLVSARLSA
jgi:hypothetical protein